MLLAIWAIGDNVMVGITAGEAQSPRYSMGRATKTVPFRVSAIYLIPLAFVTLIVPSDDSRLFGSSGAAASPFVIAADDAGIKGLPDFLNVVIMIGVLVSFNLVDLLVTLDDRSYCHCGGIHLHLEQDHPGSGLSKDHSSIHRKTRIQRPTVVGNRYYCRGWGGSDLCQS